VVCLDHALTLNWLQIRSNLMSMSRLLVLGKWPVLLTHVLDVFSTSRAGLRAQDVNGADKQNVDSAKRFISKTVRQALRPMPNTASTIAYLYFGSGLVSAFFARNMPTRRRIRLAFQTLFFVRFWRGWINASQDYTTHTNFISHFLFYDTVIAAQALVLIAVIWQRKFPQRVFCPWLLGSDQMEHLFSELRAFTRNSPNFTLFGLLSIARRWTHQADVLAEHSMTLPPILSARNYNKHIYVDALPPLRADHDGFSEAEVVEDCNLALAAVRQFFSHIGAEPALRQANMWETPPQESFADLEGEEIDDDEVAEDTNTASSQQSHAAAVGSQSGGADPNGVQAPSSTTGEARVTSADSPSHSATLDEASEAPSIRVLAGSARHSVDIIDAVYAASDQTDTPTGARAELAYDPNASGEFDTEDVLDSKLTLDQMLVIMCGSSEPIGQADDSSRSPDDYVLVNGHLQHKSTALVSIQSDKYRKLKPGRDRFKTNALAGVRFDDDAGDGFHAGQAYQLQEITEFKANRFKINVSLALVLELRKSMGTRSYPRLSVKKADSALALIQILVQDRGAGTWSRAQQPYRTISVTELGCKANLQLSAGGFDCKGLQHDCGGRFVNYESKDVPHSVFARERMLSVDKRLNAEWTVAELKSELKAHRESSSGLRKPELLKRLRCVLIGKWLVSSTPAAVGDQKAAPDPFGGREYDGDLAIVRSAANLSAWTTDRLREVLRFHKDQPRFATITIRLGALKESLVSQVRAVAELDALGPRGRRDDVPAGIESKDTHDDKASIGYDLS
jgi:hypothetical protein